MLGKGCHASEQGQNGGGLPIVTMPADQTKNQVILHVFHPTKPYQDLCSRCETLWQIRFGLPTLTNRPFWLYLHSIVLLPTLTSRGVKYTHDIKHTVLHHHSGPTRIRLVSQSRHQSSEVVGDPPTPRHSVADSHAVVTLIHGGHPDPRPRHPGRTA